MKPRRKGRGKFIYFDYASDILSPGLRRSCLKYQFCSIYTGSQLWYRARISILARLIFGAGSFFLPYIIDVSRIPGLYPPDTNSIILHSRLMTKPPSNIANSPRMNYHPPAERTVGTGERILGLKSEGCLSPISATHKYEAIETSASLSIKLE